MTFEELLDQALAMLQRRGRVTYRTLQRQFDLDEATLADLKDAICFAHPQVVEEERGLVWPGSVAPTLAPLPPSQPVLPPDTHADQPTPVEPPLATLSTIEAERRQLTVLFCDLADSTRLARQLDPEDLRDVIRAYQATCVAVIQRFASHVAQYLGDGLLVYFGYPQAHEDDAQRAVRTGLGMLAAMATLNTDLARDQGVRLAVRVGIHTGLVVVGEMGSGGRHEPLALGDTPNLAARLQGLAAPDTVVMSAATARLVQGYFTCEDHGTQALKGIETPVHVYQAMGESAAQSRLDVAGATGLTPLVGREAEVTLLRERWAQSTDGLGQVVVLSGEAGIGKSRLVHVLTERVVDTHTPRLTLRCSPYHTNSALYPVIEHLQRLLHWQRDVSPSLAFARYWAAFVFQVCRGVPAVYKQAEAGVALSTERGFPLWGAAGTSMRGWALAMQNQGAAGIAQVHQGIAAWRASGGALWVPYYCTLLADVADHLGHPEDGLQTLTEAHALVEQHEERFWEAEICRLQGVLLLRHTMTPQAEAETWLQRALDVARRQQAKSLELRAAMSLARLWQQQGKRDAARELLAPIYGWFTEGFDTADLQEARALLDELA
jgi:class 3 adenylate cyclase